MKENKIKNKIKKYKCHLCGKEATIRAKDPYIEELYPEEKNPMKRWCDDCYQNCIDDI